jgi:protein-S-isoprenylcysteine O-methyltransferase Ste14
MDSPPNSRTKLAIMAAWRWAAGVLFLGLLIFVPAGTLAYWQAWAYIGLMLIPVAIVGSYLLIKDPVLLERRMRMGEREPAQRTVVLVSSILMVLILTVPGLDHRFGWSDVPGAIVVGADMAIFLGYLLFAATLRENRFASRVVEVEAGQVVIRTGPYGLVRHPMYLAMSLMFALAPLALGSWWGLLPSVIFPFTLVGRIRNEEQLLAEGLPGYAEYCREVPYRLVPFIW